MGYIINNSKLFTGESIEFCIHIKRRRGGGGDCVNYQLMSTFNCGRKTRGESIFIFNKKKRTVFVKQGKKL